jgi:hypothetical protein
MPISPLQWYPKIVMHKIAFGILEPPVFGAKVPKMIKN